MRNSSSTPQIFDSARRRWAHVERSPGGPELRIDPGNGGDREDVEADADDARDDAGDEQLADVGRGHDAVDHHDHARRNEDAERAAGGDRAGGEAVGVAVAPHRRHRHLGHGRRRRHARAGHRGKAAAGGDRRHRQAAAAVAEERVGAIVELLAEAGAIDEAAHEDEQRQHREIVGDRGLVTGLSDHRQRGMPVGEIGKAGKADESHAEGDRRAEEQQRKDGDETDDRCQQGRPIPCLRGAEDGDDLQRDDDDRRARSSRS